jgi:hypothetical protein
VYWKINGCPQEKEIPVKGVLKPCTLKTVISKEHGQLKNVDPVQVIMSVVNVYDVRLTQFF